MAIDQELLNAIELMNQGKEEGFNILYSRTYNYVYRNAKCLSHNEEDALDLTQDTFIQAYKGIGSLRDPNKIYSWLGGILKRRTCKFYDKTNDEILVYEEAEDIFENIESTDIAFRPEESAQAKATSDIVMNLIEELPELQKAAIMAFYYDNMKIDDIAEMFECSANTIKSRLNYAKKFLKEKVTEHEKRNNYKLCSLSPAIILWAFDSLFATDGYRLSKTTAQAIYNAACSAVGLVPGAITVGGTAGATVAATTSGAGVGATATTGVKASGGMAAIAGTATKAGLTLGAKLGIAVATVAVTGAVATGAYVYNESANDTPAVQTENAVVNSSYAETEEWTETEPSLSETSSEANATSDIVETIETNETTQTSAETEITDAYGWERYAGTYLYRDGAEYPENGGCMITIKNVEATSESEADVMFDIDIENVDAYTQTTENLSIEDVGINNDSIYFEAVSSTNRAWWVSLFFMPNGSIRMIADVSDPDMGGYTLRLEGGPTILTKIAYEEDFATDLKLEEGTYQFTTGDNAAYDGGYILIISDLSDTGSGQSFSMVFDIVSENGSKVDEIVPMHSTSLKGNMCTFGGETSWGNYLNGYFYVLEDGSIALAYDSSYINPDMRWYGAYPEYTESIVILQKK